MNDCLFFSIICPVYNSAKTLLFSIESIKRQTYQNWELIIIDDGSTDNSGTICDDYASKDKRIVVIHQENKGQSAARLKGLEIANGDYVLFLDSDDCYENKALELLFKEINKNKVDAILYNARKENFKTTGTVYSLGDNRVFVDKKAILIECFAKRTAGYFWTYCFKKSVFHLDETIFKKFCKIKYSEDLYLIYQIISKNINSLSVISDVLYDYIDNINSITHNQTVIKVKDRFETFNEVYSELSKKFNIIPVSGVASNIGWTYLSFVTRAAKEYGDSEFKKICIDIRNSFVFKTMGKFKKDKYNSMVHILFKCRMYRILYFIIRRH